MAHAFKERVIAKGPTEEGGDADNIWMKMVTCICKAVSQEFGVFRGSGSEIKDT